MPAIPALIVGAATAGGAALSAGAARHASQNAADTATQNNALQSQIYGSNKSLIQPYVDAGAAADRALEGFLGLGGDPAATRKAFDDYLGSTGYQFTRQQGLDAVTQRKAAAGLLGSGATLKALDAYGTGLANQFGQQYADNLAGVSNRGVNAAGALTGAGQAYANAANANTNTAVGVSANAGLTAAGRNTNGLIGSALAAYGTLRGQSSYGGGTNAMTGYPALFNQPGYAPFGG